MNIISTPLAQEARRVAIPLGKSCDYLNISYMKDNVFLSASRGNESINIEIFQAEDGHFSCYARTYITKGKNQVLKESLLEEGSIGALGIAVRQYLDKRKAA